MGSDWTRQFWLEDLYELTDLEDACVTDPLPFPHFFTCIIFISRKIDVLASRHSRSERGPTKLDRFAGCGAQRTGCEQRSRAPGEVSEWVRRRPLPLSASRGASLKLQNRVDGKQPSACLDNWT